MARNLFGERLQDLRDDLSNRIGLWVDLNLPTWRDVLVSTRNFVVKPYYRWQADRLVWHFSDELANAPQRYKPCWARLAQGRITLSPELGMRQSQGPYANAKVHLGELLDFRKRLANRRWYQVSALSDWADLAQSTRLCLDEWFEQVARCGLELCQDGAEAFVPEHFEPEEAEVILERVRGVRFPEKGSRSTRKPITIDGRCQRLD